MANLFCGIGTNRIIEATITIPNYGIWYADVKFDQDVTMGETGFSLDLADLSMRASVYRRGNYQGSTRARIIGGAAGWHQKISAKFYDHVVGVKASMVLQDAAREVGESIQLANDFIVGPSFVRQEAHAGRVLSQLAGSLWFMRPDGVTYSGARDSSFITSRFDVIGFNTAEGRGTVATDFPADWMPGRKFSTALVPERTISAVIHTISGANFRTEILVLP